jgi:hypothetical protein
MKIIIILAAVGLFVVGTLAVAFIIAVLRARAQAARESEVDPDDPLLAMFRANSEAYAERQREAIAELAEDDPYRKWIEAGTDWGWMGYSDYLFSTYFTESTEGIIEPVRAIQFRELKRLPRFASLPQPNEPFGLDLANAPLRDRDLPTLANFAGLKCLSLSSTQLTDAGLKHLAKFVDVEQLDLRSTEVTAAGMKHLRQMPALRYLTVSLFHDFSEAVPDLREMTKLNALTGAFGISDDDLRELAPLTNLTHMELQYIITNAGLKYLRPFGRLLVLKISSNDMTDDGLVHLSVLGALQKLTIVNYDGNIRGRGLAGLSGLRELRHLIFDNNALAGEGFEHFASLPKLRELSLNNNPVTDAGIARLRLPPGLESLSLDRTKLTDAGLPRLELPDSVTRLCVAGTEITDESIPLLARFRSLTYMNIANTKLTLPGAHRLADELPNCQIQTSFPQ